MSRMDQSSHAYGWVMLRLNESCYECMSHVTYEWVMSRMNESCHACISHVRRRRMGLCIWYGCGTTESYGMHVLGEWVYIYDMGVVRGEWVWYDGEWVHVWMHECMSHATRVDEAYQTVTWLIYVCYASVSHDSFTHCHTSHAPVLCLICISTRVTVMRQTYISHGWDMSHAWMSHVTRMNELCHIHEGVM